MDRRLTSAGAPVLEIEGIDKAFGPVSVLRGVGMRVRAGTIHALLGTNGAGKSTLMRILVGAERADRGTMTLRGRPYAPRAPADARRNGVAFVPQERTLCPDLTVEENIVLGLEPTRGGLLRRASARALVERAIGLVTAAARRIPLDVRAKHLGVADQQLVEIARALCESAPRSAGLPARVLVLDEPTSSLGHDDAARLFARLHTLRASGVAVILVTHFLSDVRAHADRYTVIRDGEVRGEGDPKEASLERIVREMLGRDLDATPPPFGGGDVEQEVALEVKDLGGRARPRKASFSLRRGEVLGIAGLVGSGRTELLRLLAGLEEPARGTVSLRGARGVGLLSEDRGGEGLMLERSIADNVTLSRRGPLFATPTQVLAEGARWIGELGIRAKGPAQPVVELSGGNQQKVQLARLVREDHDVLLIDEPTRGIDVASKAQVLRVVRELANANKAIVLVSSDFDELLATCDTIAVLRRGELGPPRRASEWTEEGLLLEASS